MDNNFKLNARITKFDGSHEADCIKEELPAVNNYRGEIDFAGANWELHCKRDKPPERPDAIDYEATLSVEKGQAEEISVGVELEVTPWTDAAFVMLPSAAYNGNRYPVRHYDYPPMVHEPGDTGPDAPTLITDVPRLNHKMGAPSRMQLSSGDLTTPCMCFYEPTTGTGMVLLSEQGTTLGNHGFTVEENKERNRAFFRVETPCVRRDYLYTMVNTSTPSWDRGADWEEGQSVSVKFRLFAFPVADVQELYDRFVMVRKDITGEVRLKNELPFSAAFDIIEDKYQRENWCEEGYYRVGTHEAAKTSPAQDWQTGWVGGGISPCPLLMNGKHLSRKRAIKNIDWMFSEAQLPSGLFYATYSSGQACSDGFGLEEAKTWYMVRKQADALYFLLKSFQTLAQQDDAWMLPRRWADGTRLLADRFTTAFNKYGQLGQYLDCETGEVVVGGSTAAAMAPGALALAGDFFEQENYLDTAENLAAQLDKSWVKKGVTTGGPGEILKCPDSESAFAMLESFITLYEITGKNHWLERSVKMANQCLSWCATYDFVFPPNSPLGKADVRAAGSVWANVQNKHSSPGICTLSGDALFRLFRYTGCKLYLDQIQETAHNLTQYVSRKDRPLGDPETMKPGYICERVNFSDWEGTENVGGHLFGSCWPEASMLLTAAELPGIYLQKDTDLLCVFDHMNAEIKGHTLCIKNPTEFDAVVSVFAEESTQTTSPLSKTDSVKWPKYEVDAGEKVEFEV